jgi:Transcription factor IIIC subunit delta N-term
VTALKWSPPGLTEFDRSALSILTSNLVLSIWARGSRSSSANLQRAVIVNHALASHYKKLNPNGKGDPVNGQRSDGLKRFQRIRSFVWAPSLDLDSGSSADRPSLIAVANDEAKVFVLNVNSPFTSLPSTGRHWSTSIILAFDAIDGFESKRPTTLWTFEDYISNPCFVNHLTWSPWVQHNDIHLSFIAYESKDAIVCRKIVYAPSASEQDFEMDGFQICIPLQKAQKVRSRLHFDDVVHKRRITLLAQVNQEILCCSISTDKGHKYTIARYNLESWDELAGWP